MDNSIRLIIAPKTSHLSPGALRRRLRSVRGCEIAKAGSFEDLAKHAWRGAASIYPARFDHAGRRGFIRSLCIYGGQRSERAIVVVLHDDPG